jgi:DNA-binding XRE family transcriptional regulator
MECLGSFNVAAKKIAAAFPKLQVNDIYWRQMLFIAGKHFFCRHINKLQAGPARTLKIGKVSSEFNIVVFL